MAGRFEGQVAVITGAASGIGLAVAHRLAEEGARVALWDRDRAALEKAAAGLRGDPVIAAVDVTDAAALAGAAADAKNRCGRIDALVASAGITGPNAPTWEYPVDDWRLVIDVNLTGVFLANRAVAPIMRAAGYGRIVNIASVAGKEGNPNAPAYSASKAGVIGLSKSLGKELAGSGVTVNCVTPAAIRTPIFEQMTEEFIAYMLSKIPMKRFGELEEAAALITWVASAECSFSTGAVFDLSGGRATY
jgi:NAD(P)-dependent dehydrogenase (short-subunit alcohol dehydrogenase family)